MKVYLIEKSSGSYDDYYNYVDTGFFDENKAEEYIEKYNIGLTNTQKQGDECSECCCGKYQYLSKVIRNCKLGIKKSDISEIEKFDGDLWFECTKKVDGYSANDEHPARIVEIEIQ